MARRREVTGHTTACAGNNNRWFIFSVEMPAECLISPASHWNNQLNVFPCNRPYCDYLENETYHKNSPLFWIYRCQAGTGKMKYVRFQTYLTELYESICTVPIWQYGPSICTHGHEAIQGLPGSDNTRQAPKIILVIMCMRCLFVELNIVADSRVYGNLNLGHRGRVMHTGVGELGHH